MAFFKSLALLSTLASVAHSAPLVAVNKRTDYPNPYVGNAPSTASLPLPAAHVHINTLAAAPKVQSSVYTDTMKFYDRASGANVDVKADLGYSGVINGFSMWVFGDTFLGSTPNAVDSSGTGHLDHPAAMTINMQSTSYIAQFIADTASENSVSQAEGGNMGFGGTNIVETSPNNGIVYYEKIHRTSSSSEVIGAGLATITLNGDGSIQNVERNGETMWNSVEPAWGDIGATKDSTHLYLWGHGPPPFNYYGYVARVPLGSEKDVDAYEYYDAATSAWSPQRISSTGAFGTRKIDETMAVWGYMDMFQAAPFWNAHYGTWMWLYGTDSPQSDINLATADSLAGPWTKHGVVAQTESPSQGALAWTFYKYAINAHPEYDPSGKTSYVTWAIDNTIYGTIITWE